MEWQQLVCFRTHQVVFLRVHVDMCYKRMISLAFSKQNIKLGLVEDTVIEVIARLEFEDGSPP